VTYIVFRKRVDREVQKMEEMVRLPEDHGSRVDIPRPGECRERVQKQQTTEPDRTEEAMVRQRQA